MSFPIPSTARNALDAGRAWLTANVLEAATALFGLRGTLRLIERVVPGEQAAPSTEETLQRYERAAGRALRWSPWADTCLRRSLVTYALGRRDGLAVRLLIGVRTCPEFEAHAWVEAGNQRSFRDAYEVLLVRPEHKKS